jgi:hypothetical protein
MMDNMAQSFFQDLYRADPEVCREVLLSVVQPKTSEHTNMELCKEFSVEEIGDALFQIAPLKAPSPDGFPARFFQKTWEVKRQDITRGVQNFFEMGEMPSGINETSIVLIPKKDNPELLKDFKPISICNVIYKVVSKCLVNSLRPILQDVIAPTQSTFIPGRLITDNTLIAFECLHAIRNGSSSCKKFGAYKLDLSKAYNRVDWSFLDGVLHRLGFHRNWI